MHSDPIVQFGTWFREAQASEPTLPDAAALATATPDGLPAVRMVLLKAFNHNGLVFYTNRQSRKADELKQNPRAALLFHWKSLGRQIRIEGDVEPVSDAHAKTYFDTRPRKSRLSAWASPQSQEIPDRTFLERRMAEFEQKYLDDDIPLPPFWGGYCITPNRFEFWIDRRDRLHDRFLYIKQSNNAWKQSRLAP